MFCWFFSSPHLWYKAEVNRYVEQQAIADIRIIKMFCLTFYINISSHFKLCPPWKRNILTCISLRQHSFFTIFRSLQLKVVQRVSKSFAQFFIQVRTILNLQQMKIFVFLQERLCNYMGCSISWNI